MVSSDTANMTSGRRDFLKYAGAGAVGSAAAMAGCLGDDDEETPPGDENVLRGLLAKTIVSRDPHKIEDADTISLADNAYDGLVTEGADGSIVGDLAEDWRFEDDGQTLIFELREGLQTHAGNDLTADDVVYSAERYLTVGTAFSSLWVDFLEVGDIVALNDREVEFNLTEAYGPFLAVLILFLVVDSEEVMEHEEDGPHPEHGDFGEDFLDNNYAGTGPYVNVDFARGEFYEFEKFEEYYRGWDDNQFDQVVFDIVLEAGTQRTMMREGEADFSDIFMSPDAYDDIADSPAAWVSREPTVQIYEKILNVSKPPFDDIDVRRAFNLATDFEACEDLMDAEPAQGPVPIILPEHNDDIPILRQDLEAAEQAIEDSSYTLEEINDIDIDFVWIEAAPIEEHLALIIVEALEEIGITSVNIVADTWANWVGDAADPETAPHIGSLYHTGNYPSAEQYLYGKYHPNVHGSYNASNFYHDDEELINVIDQARSEPDEETRFDLWREAQEVAFEAYPGIFLTNPPYFIGLNENLGYEYRGGTQGFQRKWYYMTRTGEGRATP